MRLATYIVSFGLLFVLSVSVSSAEVKNERAIGLLLGDPIALSLKFPVRERTFLNIRAGIWTWSFWHDIRYDTPYLSLDYAWLFPFRKHPLTFYIGGGVALFLADNPKDKDDYDAAAAVRLPLGLEFYSKDSFSLSFELAPIYQVAPPFSFKPYVLELNGGLVVMYSF
jgi:hypothetical protein